MPFPRFINKTGDFRLVLETNSKPQALKKRAEMKKKGKEVFLTEPRVQGMPKYWVFIRIGK